MTNSELKLAEICASQIKQIGISELFLDAMVSGNESEAMTIIEIAAAEWQRKINKIQTICLTKPGASRVIADIVMDTI